MAKVGLIEASHGETHRQNVVVPSLRETALKSCTLRPVSNQVPSQLI